MHLLCYYNFYVGDRFYYGIRIVTGNQKACSATAQDVFLTVTGTKSKTDKMSLVSLGLFQRLRALKFFQQGTYDDMIIETDQNLGDIEVVGVGLHYDWIRRLTSALLDHHWYVEYVSIIDFKDEPSETETRFPCYHWLGYNNKEVTAVSKVGKCVCVCVCACVRVCVCVCIISVHAYEINQGCRYLRV